MSGDDDLESLDPRERARARRRDRDLSAVTRDLMRTGQAKVFKQVLDRQARRASEPTRGGSPNREATDGVDATQAADAADAARAPDQRPPVQPDRGT